jgi:AraC family transcriptional activator of pobA
MPASQPLRPTDVLLAQGLFGESTQLPDVMHCETIAMRSVLHEWELAPHRHARLHQILLVHSGSGVAHLDGEQIAFGDRSLVNVPPGAVHGFRFKPGTQGFVVTLADEIMDRILGSAPGVRHLLGRPALCNASQSVLDAGERIWFEFGTTGEARSVVLQGLCATLLGLTARHVGTPAPGPQAPLASTVLQRFEALVEAHYLQRWGVADYARALAISPTHLSRVVRAATGAPASQWIDARTVREARQRLAYTHLRITTIGYALGFADPAHFSRVFTRIAGVSPRAFRQRLAR